MPVDVFDKMYDHVLTDAGMDIFRKDIAETNERLSPVPELGTIVLGDPYVSFDR